MILGRFVFGWVGAYVQVTLKMHDKKGRTKQFGYIFPASIDPEYLLYTYHIPISFMSLIDNITSWKLIFNIGTLKYM